MKQDPKYKYGSEDKIWHRNGNYWIPEDEPLITFRGKDMGTLVAMAAYKKFMDMVAEEAETDKAREVGRSHAESIQERIDTISKWQEENMERVGLGCHTCKAGAKPNKINKIYEKCQKKSHS